MAVSIHDFAAMRAELHFRLEDCHLSADNSFIDGRKVVALRSDRFFGNVTGFGFTLPMLVYRNKVLEP